MEAVILVRVDMISFSDRGGFITPLDDWHFADAGTHIDIPKVDTKCSAGISRVSIGQ
jgi:hypothetical protein